MIWALIFLPVVSGGLAFLIKNDSLRRSLLLAASFIHLALIGIVFLRFDGLSQESWLGIDALSLLFLGITDILFLAASIYAVGYLRHKSESSDPKSISRVDSGLSAETVLTGCMLLFLGSMTLVMVSRHLGLLWVGIEATTLSSAPLIYFNRNQGSLEATWRYLLICSVGIALALLGNFFLAVATSVAANEQMRLSLDQLTRHARYLDPTWLKAGFLLLLVGYGTKMGLVPMHTWLPDAHSEAPAMVSALLSGALLNCAFVGILRVLTILTAAGLGDFGRQQMLLFGMISMAVAALFLILQTDFKRMLAYSSIEHMGVLALGIGLGSAAGFGALFHALNHSLAKAALFLIAGNILIIYKTKKSENIVGISASHPLTAVLWAGGTLAILGSPPFGLFSSELMILKGIISNSQWWIAAGYLISLAVALSAISYKVFRMIFGAPTEPSLKKFDKPWMIIAPSILILCVLIIGIYLPQPLADLLTSASAAIVGK